MKQTGLDPNKHDSIIPNQLLNISVQRESIKENKRTMNLPKWSLFTNYIIRPERQLALKIVIYDASCNWASHQDAYHTDHNNMKPN